MHIIIISTCHRHMLTTTTHHQNKSYSESRRQYAKRRTKALFPSANLFIKNTKCHQKIISHSGGCLGAVILWYSVKNMKNKLWSGSINLHV